MRVQKIHHVIVVNLLLSGEAVRPVFLEATVIVDEIEEKTTRKIRDFLSGLSFYGVIMSHNDIRISEVKEGRALLGKPYIIEDEGSEKGLAQHIFKEINNRLSNGKLSNIIVELKNTQNQLTETVM